MSFTEGQMLYRAESRDGYCVHYREWVVVKVTPKGGWIATKRDHDYYESLKHNFPHEDHGEADRRWVAHDGRKRFAYPTKEEALQSLRARASSYAGHCLRRYERARERAKRLEAAPRSHGQLRPLRLTDIFHHRDFD